MHVKSIRIRNYRSIFDSGELHFNPGFNLLVGANNVGKSSLLACIGCKISAEPHRSLRTLPHRNDPLDQMTRLEFVFGASGAETRRLLFQYSGQLFFPWPADTPFTDEHRDALLSRILVAPMIPFHGSFEVLPSHQDWKVDEYPTTRLYEPLVQPDLRMLRFSVARDRALITVTDRVSGRNANDDVGFALLRLLSASIYRFDAERLSLGHGQYGTATELTPNASNLPEVLSNLQSNPAAFKEFNDLVQEVFPEIKAITARTSRGSSHSADILVWQVDPHSQRDDLAIPLVQCGTGVGQVLAILYVAKASVEPRTIIIDEPGSFLHPGASRALIGILKRFQQHQYIIATHSPEILAELANAPVTIVRYENSQSVFEQAPSTTGEVAQSALTEVGAKLSDVFGFDRILWVEGQSDALSIKALLELAGRLPRGLAILPVRDTGAFKRRTLAEILDIYRTLSMGAALLPPAILFLFDRDGRTPTEIEDVIRQSQGKVRFLARRMFENYLLHPESLANLFNEAGAEHELRTSDEEVRSWLVEKGARFCAPADAVFSKPWTERVDGAALLDAMFTDLSASRLSYKKTTHGPRLTTLLYQHHPDMMGEILALLDDVVD